MKGKRHSPEQIVRKLREVDMALGTGTPLEQILRRLDISESTYHRWRSQYGRVKVKELRRIRELQRENDRLKKLLAEQALDNEILKEVTRGNF